MRQRRANLKETGKSGAKMAEAVWENSSTLEMQNATTLESGGGKAALTLRQQIVTY